MLAAFPVRRTPHLNSRRSLAPVRIYPSSVAAGSRRTAKATPALRTGELQPIGQLLPQVLARYLSLKTEE